MEGFGGRGNNSRNDFLKFCVAVLTGCELGFIC